MLQYLTRHGPARILMFVLACLVPTGAANAQWWDANWLERTTLTFKNTAQSENLADFPVLVKLDSRRIDYTKTQDAGEDIRFIDSDDSTVLSHEIELWDESGTSYVWVKVPQVDGSSDTDFIYMYYDNFIAPDGQDRDGTWSNGFAGVWHLNESPANGVAGFADSTGPDDDAWWNGSWGERVDLVFKNAAQSENLIDFPVLVKIDSIDYTKTLNSGEDLRFIDADGATVLSHEIELWDETGASYVWVKVSQIDGSSDADYITMYYDNSGALDGQNAADVWSNGYLGVWHMAEDPDSTPPWPYRKKITIDNTKVTATLTDFPVLVSITDTDIRDEARSDGYDIYFTDDDGSTRLDHEIERWDDSTGELIAWVKIPSLPDSVDKDFYIYYGNSGATDQQNAPGVWSNSYVGVWHLKEDPGPGGAGDMKDSKTTSNGTAENNMAPTDLVPAQIGDGVDFDGDDDEVEMADSALLSITGALTVSAWVYIHDLSGTESFHNAGIVSKYSNTPSTDQRAFALFVDEEDNDDRAKFMISPDGDTPVTIVESVAQVSEDTWYYLTGVYDPSTSLKIYIDGTVNATNTASIPASIADTTSPLWIARQYGGTATKKHIDAIIDEVRLSNIDRSADWIQTEYNNQFNPGTFHSLSAEEPNPFTILDRTGNYYNGEPIASMDSSNLVTAQIGNGLDFGGFPPGDYVDVGDIGHLGTTYTVSAWVTDNGQSKVAVGYRTSDQPDSWNVPIQLLAGAGDAKFTVRDDATVLASADLLGALTGSIDHLVGVRNGDNLSLYVNAGTPATASASFGTFYMSKLLIGNWWNDNADTTGNHFFDGIIDEVRISTVARSADWINAQYLSQSNQFTSWNAMAYPATPKNFAGFPGSTTAGTGQIAGGIETNGVTDLVEVGDVLDMGTSDWTVSAWFKTADDGYVVSKAWDVPDYGLRINAATHLRARLHNGTTNTYVASAITTEFHHGVGVWDRDGDMTVYIDGVGSTVDISGDSSIDVSNSTPLTFGASCQLPGCASDSNHLNASIDEIRIATVARSADWVKAQYLSQADQFIKWKPRIYWWAEVEPN